MLGRIVRFINRVDELAFLQKYHEKPGFQFIPLWGRRRVREFIRGKRALYFIADSVTEAEQL